MSKSVIGPFLVTILLLSGLFSTNLITQAQGPPVSDPKCRGSSLLPSQAKIEHIPVLIISESDFSFQGWSGTGTLEDPYVIENIWVHGENSYGISMGNINAYVLIRNVKIEIDGLSALYLRDCLSVTLEDVNIVGGQEGIHSTGVLSLNITGGSMEEVTDIGLITTDTLFHFIKNMNFLRCNSAAVITGGLFLYQQVNVTGGQSGINAVGALASSFLDCLFSDCTYYGLRLASCSLMILNGNAFNNCSIQMSGGNPANWMHTMIDNSVNGKPFGYILADDGSTIDLSEYGSIIVALSQNTILTGGTISDVSVGIEMAYCSGCLINDTTFEQCTSGIEITGCNLTTIQYCSILNGGYGVLVEESANITIYQNTIIQEDYGIFLDWGTTNCSINLNQFAELYGLRDNGRNNTWDGNFYDDYDMSGEYHIPGSASSVDSNPQLYGEDSYLGTVITIIFIAIITGIIIAIVVLKMRR